MRWWTSDLHFGHANIIEYCNRPYWTQTTVKFALGDAEVDVPDVDEMNRAMIENWNDRVDAGDEVWVVGDLAMGARQHTVPLAKALKGKKYLVPGNHDTIHRMYPHWRQDLRIYEGVGFTILDPQVETVVDGTDVLVCHFPYTGDSRRDGRFSGLRPDDNGGWLIHGHTHAVERLRGRQIHVGVDAHAFAPVSEDWVASVIRDYPDGGTIR